MGIAYNNNFYGFKTAKELLQAKPIYVGKDGYYLLSAGDGTRQLVWCDMTTDGGGWMMIARSHPSVVNYNGSNWGWRGGNIGSVKDFSQAYQAGWYTHWIDSSFTEFIVGNRSNINDNNWGYFVYKTAGLNYTTFMTSDTQQSGTRSTLKFDTSVYQWTSVPGMQGAIGFSITGTANNNYYMRDCCGYSSSYGGKPTGLTTTYCGSDSVLEYSGPWCGGSAVDGSGNFLSGTYTTAGGNRYGGTNQYMIMVR